MHAPTQPAAPPDLQHLVHKALRGCLFDTLLQVGRIDVSDARQLQDGARRVRQLLDLVGEWPGPLHDALQRLGCGALEQRATAARTLYQALSDWTLHKLQQMAAEESQRTLLAPQAAMPVATRLAALGDDELCDALHWMGRTLGPQELAWLLAHLQPAGGDRFGLALQALGTAMDGPAWDALARAMDLPQVTVPVLRPALSLAA